MSRSRHKILLLSLLLILLPIQLGLGQARQPSPESFRRERSIIPGGSGPNRLLIDSALLAGSSSLWQFSQQTSGSEPAPMVIAAGGLKDFRIYDSSNRETPYLLISPPAPESKWFDGRLSPLAPTKKNSGFQVDLGRPLLTDRLQLNGLQAPFVKRCILEASNDGNRWIKLRLDATIFDLPAEKLKLLEIEFERAEYRFLKITWDDSASARIALPRAVSARLLSAGSLPPRLEVRLQLERRGSEPGASRYRIHLPAPHLPITEIKLSANGENILRQARITEGRLSGDEIISHVLGTAILRREVRGELAAAEMSIPIAPPKEAQLDLIVEDGDNPPLEITEISAFFAYLPYIYFESAGKETLTARYGHAGLKEPHYDLEAVRESAVKAQTSEARWAAEREIKLTGNQANTGMPQTGSSIDLSGFRYARSIAAGKSGLCALPLDAAILAHSKIADLRIAGADGRQIPYLVEKLDEPLSLDLPALETTQAPLSNGYDNRRGTSIKSYYRLRLPFKDLPAARLVFTTSARVFRRDLFIMIENNPINGRQKSWIESIGEATWRHEDPELAAQAIAINIPSLKTDEALVIVEEGDNSPLPITSIKLLLPAYRLRFFRGSAMELKLYYGRNDIDAPRYDLAILSPRLVGAAANEIQLGPEIETAAIKLQPLSLKFFWGILIGAVLILLVLISRLVKKT